MRSDDTIRGCMLRVGQRRCQPSARRPCAPRLACPDLYPGQGGMPTVLCATKRPSYLGRVQCMCVLSASELQML